MCNALKIICALSILTTSAFAQNEIDHINTLYQSGYGKLTLDGDTLYVNVLNGHGVERYYIADPANPIFIDREEVSGFDQIDFGRRLMAKLNSDYIILASFDNWDSTRVLSNIPLPQILAWKLAGNFIMVISSDDSIRTYNIGNLGNPLLTSSYGLHRPWGEQYSTYIAFGSTVCVIINGVRSYSLMIMRDLYDIRFPDNVDYVNSDSLQLGQMGQYYLHEANGDTISAIYGDMLGEAYINFIQFFPDGNLTTISLTNSLWPPQSFRSSLYGYINIETNGVQGYVFSYSDMAQLGEIPLPLWTPFNFEIFDNQYLFYDQDNFLNIFQATHSQESMPVVDSLGPAHSGVLSSASYGNYILSGAQSNGGELLIHSLDQSNQLNLISTVPPIDARKIITAGSSAICLCPGSIFQVDLSHPAQPVISHFLIGFESELLDCAFYDSTLYVIKAGTYYVIDYDSLSGMSIRSLTNGNWGSQTSLAQYQTTSILLDGNQANLLKIDAVDPVHPVIVQEKQLPPDTFQNLDVINGTIWASGHRGTYILDVNTLDSLAFLGPEYFSDVHQIYASGETLYVADGINGIKMFTFQNNPYTGLHYVGGYSTGNVVNQLSTIGNNFFVSDYYSLQHLRWGAPTGIEGPNSPRPPEQFSLMQNYPNPFNSATTIRYALPENDKANLMIFDITGREIRRLPISGTSHEVIWDGANRGGQPVSSGVYFYTINGHQQSARKMVLLR